MAVDNHKTVEKQTVAELIKNKRLDGAIFTSAPIEHYTIEELKELADIANEKDMAVVIKAEYSNFYQGVLVSLVYNDDVKLFGLRV